MPGSGQLGSGEPGRGLAAGRAVRRQGRAGPRAQPRGGCGGGNRCSAGVPRGGRGGTGESFGEAGRVNCVEIMGVGVPSRGPACCSGGLWLGAWRGTGVAGFNVVFFSGRR